MGTACSASHASFDETNWALVCALADSNAEFAEAAMARLLRDYWTPIFAYIRRSGYSRDDALDLTQDFVARVILQRGLFERADRDRGRFRALVKTSIRNFLTEEHRRSTAQKRRPVTLRPLGPGLGVQEPIETRTPEAAFDYQLATTALQRAIQETHRTLAEDGLQVHGRLLEEKILRPILTGGDGPSFDELAVRHGLADARQASNFAAVARRRFQRELRREVARWLESDADVDAELGRLIQSLTAGSGARTSCVAGRTT